MNTPPLLLTALGILSLLLVGSPVAAAADDNGKWYDTFGIAGGWHFHVSEKDSVKVTLNGQTIFERGPEYAFEDENMVSVFGPHYGGAVIDFEYIAPQEL